MANNKYAYNKDVDEAKTARAMAKSLKISPKHCVEICNAIRGMEVAKAKTYLEDVIDMKKSVPFKRHNRGVGHRKGQEGWASGRYPVKAAEQDKLTLEVVDYVPAVWTDAYYKKMMLGQYDIGFGGVSGNTLNPLNFFEVLKSDNSSGFTLNWGPNTNEPSQEQGYHSPTF